MSKWSGQVALVTGGTRGIGRAIAKLLLDRGVRVIITGISKQAEVPAELGGYFSVDFSDRDQVDRFVHEVGQIEGLNLLVNNAGINRIHPLPEFPASDFDEIQEVNLRAPYLVMQAAARNMIQAGRSGKIVNIASIWATHAKAGRSGYCTSKSAVLGMTRAAATDLGPHGILVNSVSPGFIQTELTQQTLGAAGMKEMEAVVPLGRLGQPEEIAKAVGFLIGPDNTYLTGQNIIVDGGFTNV